MNTYVVTESSGEIKMIAKKSLENFWVKVTIGMLIYSLLVEIVPYILALLTPESMMLTVEGVSTSYLSTLYNTFTSGAFLVGVCSFMLNFFRKRDPNPGYLFNGFGYYFKTFGLVIVMGVFIILWSMLFIIPGIIAALRYSQAYYILADDPQKGIMQCINESKALMANNKMKYFTLVLSFMGWALLIGIGQSILVRLSVPVIIIDLIFIIPAAIFAAYINTASTVFFELASGRLRAAEPQPAGEVEIDTDINEYTEVK